MLHVGGSKGGSVMGGIMDVAPSELDQGCLQSPTPPRVTQSKAARSRVFLELLQSLILSFFQLTTNKTTKEPKNLFFNV